MTSTLQERIRSFPDPHLNPRTDLSLADRRPRRRHFRQPRFFVLEKSKRQNQDPAWQHMGDHFENFLTKLLDLRDQAEPRALARAIVTLTELHSAVPDGHAGVDDDGEVLMFWLNGRRSVEVVVPPIGPFYARVTDAEGEELFCASTAALPIDMIRSIMRNFHTSHDSRAAETVREW